MTCTNIGTKGCDDHGPALLECNDQRRADRAQAWRRHSAKTRAREAALVRITVTRQQTAQRQRSRDQGYGFEL